MLDPQLHLNNVQFFDCNLFLFLSCSSQMSLYISSNNWETLSIIEATSFLEVAICSPACSQ